MSDFQRDEHLAHGDAIDMAKFTREQCIVVYATRKTRGHVPGWVRRLFPSG